MITILYQNHDDEEIQCKFNLSYLFIIYVSHKYYCTLPEDEPRERV